MARKTNIERSPFLITAINPMTEAKMDVINVRYKRDPNKGLFIGLGNSMVFFCILATTIDATTNKIDETNKPIDHFPEWVLG